MQETLGNINDSLLNIEMLDATEYTTTTTTTTSAVRGQLLNPTTRAEAISLINQTR